MARRLLRLEPLGQFDVRAVRVGQKCELDVRIGDRANRCVHLDPLRLEAGYERLEVHDVETDVIERAPLRGLCWRVASAERQVDAGHVARFNHGWPRETGDAWPAAGVCAEDFHVPRLDSGDIV